MESLRSKNWFWSDRKIRTPRTPNKHPHHMDAMDAKDVAAALKAEKIEAEKEREEAARVEAARLYALPDAVAARAVKKRAMEAEAALGVSGCSLFVIHSLPRMFPALREENLDDDGGGERKGGDDGGDGTGGAAEDTGIGVRKVLKEVLLKHDQLHGSGVSSSSWMVDESEDGKKVRTRCTRSVVLWAVGCGRLCRRLCRRVCVVARAARAGKQIGGLLALGATATAAAAAEAVYLLVAVCVGCGMVIE